MVGSVRAAAVASVSNSVSKIRAGAFMAAISLCLIALAGAPKAHASLNGFEPERAKLNAPDALRGDFNGDGVVDEIYSVTEGEGRDTRIGIHIRLSGRDGFADQRLTSVDARESYNLSVTAPRSFRGDCGTFSDGCSDAPITPAHDALILSLESGVELLVYLKGAEFEQAFVASDEGLMRRTLRAFYALQP